MCMRRTECVWNDNRAHSTMYETQFFFEGHKDSVLFQKVFLIRILYTKVMMNSLCIF